MIIFLDIDGVLNQLQFNYYLDEKCVQLLGVLCRDLNAELVLTSTWRFGYCKDYNKCTPQIKKLLMLFAKYKITMVGCTTLLNNRGREIKEYIETHGVDKYIILDDDRTEFDSETNELIKYFTISNKGLTVKDVKNIKKLCKKL